MARTGRPKGTTQATRDMQARVLAAVVDETLRNIQRHPENLTLDLRKLEHRRNCGATTPRIKTRLGGFSREQVINRLQELREQGLVEYYLTPEHVIRWFPVSFIPK